MFSREVLASVTRGPGIFQTFAFMAFTALLTR